MRHVRPGCAPGACGARPRIQPWMRQRFHHRRPPHPSALGRGPRGSSAPGPSWADRPAAAACAPPEAAATPTSASPETLLRNRASRGRATMARRQRRAARACFAAAACARGSRSLAACHYSTACCTICTSASSRPPTQSGSTVSPTTTPPRLRPHGRRPAPATNGRVAAAATTMRAAATARAQSHLPRPARRRARIPLLPLAAAVDEQRSGHHGAATPAVGPQLLEVLVGLGLLIKGEGAPRHDHHRHGWQRRVG